MINDIRKYRNCSRMVVDEQGRNRKDLISAYTILKKGKDAHTENPLLECERP